jgi:hypothetical protein
MAAEDLAPWVKLGDLVLRAETIRDSGRELTLTCRVRDRAVGHALEQLDPCASWGRGAELAVTYGDRSGRGRVESVGVETRSTAIRDVMVTMSVEWSTGGDSMAAGTAGFTPEDLVEAGLRAWLLHERLPERLDAMSFMVETADPLAPLPSVAVPEGSLQPKARLLVVEQLVGSRKASSVDEFALGPLASGQRRVRVGWWEPRRYSNVEPAHRVVEGTRPWS